MSEDWKAAYPVGCRVQLDIEALKAYRKRERSNWSTKIKPPYTGVVASYSRTYPETLNIVLDGRKSVPQSYPVACLRRLAEPEESA